MRISIYNKATGELETGGAELLDHWQPDSTQLIWLDFDGSDPVLEKQLLREKFSIHPLAISDAQRDRHPPKLEAFSDFTFILLKGMRSEVDSIDYQVHNNLLNLPRVCFDVPQISNIGQF